MNSSRALLLALIVTLAACSRSPAPATRPAVRVNGEEISVQQFQLASSVAAQMAQAVAPAALMESLIDRKLLAQNAQALKLDHKLQVALIVDEAREQILAEAYLENLAHWSMADESEVAKFYDQNRTLFEARRIYRVVELAFQASPQQLRELNGRVRRARGLHEVAAWLKERNLPYNIGGVAKASEQLAPRLLARLESMHEGDLAVVDAQGGASVVQLLQSDPAPLSREAAAPVIEQALRARKRAELAERERKFLRSKAKIEYVVDLRPPKTAGTTQD
jgi:EpsD family peptidyl-prolyl cis-trans isomerase